MNKFRFKISHLILFVFLVGFGVFFGYLIISSWFFFYFDWKYIFYIPTFILGSVFPVVSGFALLLHDIQCFIKKEDNSMYKDNEQ